MRFQPAKCNMMQLTNKQTGKIQASYPKLECTVFEHIQSLSMVPLSGTPTLRKSCSAEQHVGPPVASTTGQVQQKS